LRVSVDGLDVFNVLGNGQNIKLVVHNNTVFVLTQRQKESFVESGLNTLVGFGPVPLMRIHGQGMELLQARHGFEQEYN
jgi:hypothetical protein